MTGTPHLVGSLRPGADRYFRPSGYITASVSVAAIEPEKPGGKGIGVPKSDQLERSGRLGSRGPRPERAEFLAGIRRSLSSRSVHRGGCMCSAGSATAAWRRGRTSHPVRQLGPGRASRRSEGGDEHAPAIATKYFDCRSQTINSLRGQGDGALPRGSAQGRASAELIAPQLQLRVTRAGPSPGACPVVPQ